MSEAFDSLLSPHYFYDKLISDAVKQKFNEDLMKLKNGESVRNVFSHHIRCDDFVKELIRRMEFSERTLMEKERELERKIMNFEDDVNDVLYQVQKKWAKRKL